MPEEKTGAESAQWTEPDLGEVLFKWKVPEFSKPKRTYTWYFAAIVVVVALMIYSLVTANFLFALIIILVVFILFLKTYTQPKDLEFQITDEGVSLGNQFFSYREITGFYFIYDPPAVKKIFFTLRGFSPDLSVPLDNMNPIVIREKLLEYLDEDLEKENQTFDDQLETILKL